MSGPEDSRRGRDLESAQRKEQDQQKDTFPGETSASDEDGSSAAVRAEIIRAVEEGDFEVRAGSLVLSERRETVTHHSGPLPDPETFKAYDAVVPGAAERILRMAESEQQHGHALQQQGLAATMRDVRTGQFLGAGLAVAALIAAGYCAYVGAGWAAAVIGGGTVVSLATVFVYGRRGSSKD